MEQTREEQSTSGLRVAAPEGTQGQSTGSTGSAGAPLETTGGVKAAHETASESTGAAGAEDPAKDSDPARAPETHVGATGGQNSDKEDRLHHRHDQSKETTDFVANAENADAIPTAGGKPIGVRSEES